MCEVSILMSTYREDISLVEEAIDSILRQTFQDFELLIAIDDPSNNAIKARLEEYKTTDERVRVFVNESNIGLANSLNKLIDYANGRYICRMDADDIAYDNRIEVQLMTLESTGLDLLSSAVEVINESGERQYGASLVPVDFKKVNKALKWNNCAPHPAWFGKREIFYQKYRNIPLCEDYDFLLRASLRGFKIGNCAKPLLKYRTTSKSLSRSNLFEQYLYQRFITKMYSHNRVADIGEANNYVKERATEKAKKNYSLANECFNQGLALLNKKDILHALVCLSKIPFISFSYMDKIRRLSLVALISRI